MKNTLHKSLLLFSGFFFATSFAQEHIVIKLWQDSIPNAIENPEYKEIQTLKDSALWSVEKVTEPTLTLFKPQKPNGTAVIICPGGGYRHLAINKEGFKVAKWLNTLGVTAFVLKYRLPDDAIMKDKRIGPLQDAQRAMRYVRQNVNQWKIDTNKIGVLGFSAGGHLAATLSTQYNKETYKTEDSTTAKPDFSILVYPVISMKDSITHKGSRKYLLGDKPTKETVTFYSNETQVNSETPKTILIHATDDKSVPAENSLQYYIALKENGVSAEMHLYEKGGHGFGMGRNSTHPWVEACEQWLKSSKYLTTNKN